jgi:23S rRNA (pseudouridine1915-N3)-methyltransferase
VGLRLKIRLICIGKLKNPALRSLAEDYAGRIGRFVPLEIVELKDGRAADPVSRLAEEAKAITAAIGTMKGGKFPPNTVLWDERGETLDTPGFSRFLDKTFHKGATLDFILGSSHGIDPAIKKAVPTHLRLSAFTLTHEWARALALEQVYRGFCVLKGFPYHH